VPNEIGSLEPLRGYQGEDIEIQLPGSLTVYDIDWLAVWCVEYRHNFGHVFIPKDLDVPPALGQTKITVSVEANARNRRVIGVAKVNTYMIAHTERHLYLTISHNSHITLIIVYLFNNLCAPH